MNEALAQHAAVQPAPVAAQPPLAQALIGRARLVASGALAAFLGLLPHVLHHAGPLAGAALFAGAGGTILFGLVGLVAAIPFLLRLHRRTGGWRVPGGVLALMVVMFSISALVIGPKIAGGESGSEPDPAAPAKTTPVPQSPAAGQVPAEGETQGQGGHEDHH
jgi:hypothetical protein